MQAHMLQQRSKQMRSHAYTADIAALCTDHNLSFANAVQQHALSLWQHPAGASIRASDLCAACCNSVIVCAIPHEHS